MLLIADSGSTKTKWAFCTDKGDVKLIDSCGINPRFMDYNDIILLLNNELSKFKIKPEKIFFYGSGCGASEVTEALKKALEYFFNTQNVFVDTDLLGAARGLWADEAGLLAILGTGSNCCFYDGRNCLPIKPSLGYLFGDEGSGSYLGKEFIKLFLKNKLPEELYERFKNKYLLNNDIILREVYYNKFPNRYLAGFVPFLLENINRPFVESFVEKAFEVFFDEYFNDYKNLADYKLKFTGSVAFYFKDILLKTFSKKGIKISDIVKNPLQGLINYHLIN